MLFIRICAVLIGLRSLTDFGKLFQPTQSVMVFFGHMLRGTEVPVPAAGVGLFMLATAVAMWKPFAAAAPLATTYALYIPLNLLLFVLRNPEEIEHIGLRISSTAAPGQVWWLGVLGMGVYSAVAIATTAIPAWLLWKRRA